MADEKPFVERLEYVRETTIFCPVPVYFSSINARKQYNLKYMISVFSLSVWKVFFDRLPKLRESIENTKS